MSKPTEGRLERNREGLSLHPRGLIPILLGLIRHKVAERLIVSGQEASSLRDLPQVGLVDDVDDSLDEPRLLAFPSFFLCLRVSFRAVGGASIGRGRPP